MPAGLHVWMVIPGKLFFKPWKTQTGAKVSPPVPWRKRAPRDIFLPSFKNQVLNSKKTEISSCRGRCPRRTALHQLTFYEPLSSYCIWITFQKNSGAWYLARWQLPKSVISLMSMKESYLFFHLSETLKGFCSCPNLMLDIHTTFEFPSSSLETNCSVTNEDGALEYPDFF